MHMSVILYVINITKISCLNISIGLLNFKGHIVVHILEHLYVIIQSKIEINYTKKLSFSDKI